MTTKLSLAAAALAASMLIMPVSAQAHWDRGMEKNWRCHWFGWLDKSRCKVSKVYHKKRMAAKKRAMK